VRPSLPLLLPHHPPTHAHLPLLPAGQPRRTAQQAQGQLQRAYSPRQARRRSLALNLVRPLLSPSSTGAMKPLPSLVCPQRPPRGLLNQDPPLCEPRLDLELVRTQHAVPVRPSSLSTLSLSRPQATQLTPFRPSLDSYEAQQDGYDAQEKRAEVFHPDSRFLVLSPTPPPPAAGAPPPRPVPLGFCVFRFDTEETASEDDDELCDVAYWYVPPPLLPPRASQRARPDSPFRRARSYELQVESDQHGKGVGRVLMDALERTARAWRMDKVMLTVFKGAFRPLRARRLVVHPNDDLELMSRDLMRAANEQALAFYDKVGCVAPSPRHLARLPPAFPHR